jgi:diguanylate cyclase (GGDEF)-like protein
MNAAITGNLNPTGVRARSGWRVYLLIGLSLAGFAVAIQRPWGEFIRCALQVGALGAAVLGVRRHRPAVPVAWWLLVAGLALNAAGVAMYLLATPATAVGCLTAIYPVTAVALLMLGGRTRDGMLESCIVVVAAAMPAWTVLVQPALARGVDPAVAVAYPLLDLAMLGLTARLVFTGGRSPARLMLILASAALLAADGEYVYRHAHGLGPVTDDAFSMARWLTWSTLVSAAALHRSSRSRMIPTPVVAPNNPVRLAGFIILALIGPATAVLSHHSGAGDRAETLTDHVVVPVLTAILAVLLVVRLDVVARLATRRAGALDRQAADLSRALREQEALQRQLSHRTMHDPLTGLANRTLLNESLNAALSTSDGCRRPALLLLDLDGFKDVNDTFGHPVGDELLVHVADRLQRTVEHDDLLARLGGDEFAILLPATTPDRAMAVAHAALEALRAPYLTGTSELYLTTSIGVLDAAGDIPTSEALRDADLALYAAKGAGRNQVARFDLKMRTDRLSHTRLTTSLRRAVARAEFTLHYQPVIDLSTGATYAVEALLRWTPPDGPMVPPDRFIPAAEETGLIVPIGAWVLDRACADVGRWYRDHGVAVTVNVSGRQLRDRDFVHTVIDVLRRHDLPPRALVLEITETVLVTATTADAETVIGQLTRLREEGVRVAIDDFGTGYSSLSYLRRLPVDVLKIDRSFTSAADSDQPMHEWAFTKAILELSASLQLQTVAEGVETSEQARLLRRMNCTFAQGFHFSRPVVAAAIDTLLAASPQRPLAARMPRVATPSHRPLMAKEGAV